MAMRSLRITLKDGRVAEVSVYENSYPLNCGYSMLGQASMFIRGGGLYSPAVKSSDIEIKYLFRYLMRGILLRETVTKRYVMSCKLDKDKTYRSQKVDRGTHGFMRSIGAKVSNPVIGAHTTSTHGYTTVLGWLDADKFKTTKAEQKWIDANVKGSAWV